MTLWFLVVMVAGVGLFLDSSSLSSSHITAPDQLIGRDRPNGLAQ